MGSIDGVHAFVILMLADPAHLILAGAHDVVEIIYIARTAMV